jgi:hypothetical protein
MDLSQLSPSDAVVALHSLQRRYRGLFAALSDDESPDDVAHRRAGGWSAVDHIVAAARFIGGANRALARILTAESPTVPAADVDPTASSSPHARPGPVDGFVAELAAEANGMADRIEHVPGGDWTRTAAVDAGSGRTVTALDVARAAVDAGVTHLREAEKVLAAVRGRPVDPDPD